MSIYDADALAQWNNQQNKPYSVGTYWRTGLTEDEWNARNNPTGVGGPLGPTIGAWPPAGYNPLSVQGGNSMMLAPGAAAGTKDVIGGGGATVGNFAAPEGWGPNQSVAGQTLGMSSGAPSPTLGPTPYGGGPLSPSIAYLIQQGLIPDVARQSAELAGGRGVGGSPAGASTAVRMSEQDYLQRLGLANTLLGGEANRALPYQITPYQARQLQLQEEALQNQRQIAALEAETRRRYGTGRGGYGGGSGGGSGRSPQVPSYNWGGGGSYSPSNAISDVYFGGGQSLGGGYQGGQSLTLDDIYEELGFGNFGSQSGDTYMDAGDPNQPPDFDWQMWE